MFAPRTLTQRAYVMSLDSSKVPVVVGVGPAGTGKTLFACHVGAQRLREGDVRRIVMTRPAVSVDEQHGFLPGKLENKMDPWVRPMVDILSNYYSRKQIDELMYERIIEICPLAYMRGRTFDGAWVLADEMQNSTPNQMRMVLTRIGQGSKMVVTGDTDQHDRGFEENGLADLLGRVDPDDELIHVVRFGNADIQRNKVIRKILSLY